MSDHVLESMIEQYLAIAGRRASFGWQGGEPTLMGIDFFRRVIDLERKHGKPGQVIANGFQTNGVLIDREWAQFLAEHKFLVGLSLDGPERIHDHYRVDHAGRGCHARVMQAVEHLKAAGAEVNVLCMVTDVSVLAAEELFEYFVSLGLTWMQFIPCVEVAHSVGGIEPFSLILDRYGDFLCTLFDRWHNRGRPSSYIREFEEMLTTVATGQGASCVDRDRCGDYVVVEHNGDVYACDFYVTPQWRLGNLLETPLAELVNSAQFSAFAKQKGALDSRCRTCPWLKVCYGGCPRYRLDHTGQKSSRTCFCPAYEQLLSCNYELILALARRAARWQKMTSLPLTENWPPPSGSIGRNDPCPCGSGRKYKKCCMR